MSELKACPFCGQEAEINDWWRSESGTVYYVRCTGEVKGTGCRISTGAYRTPEEAKQAWNTRPLESALLSRAEKAEEKVKELEDNIISFLYFIKRGKNEKAHLQMLVIESLIDEWKRKRRPIDLPEVER